MINSPLTHMYVEGHMDSQKSFDALTREQQLNVEAGYLAKGVRQYGRTFPQFIPNLIIPFEHISLWYNGSKVYKQLSHSDEHSGIP